MPTSGRQTNTLEEYIQKLMRLISDAKTVAADDPKGLEFLINLETSILNYIKQPMDEAGMDTSLMGGAMTGAGGGPPMAGPPPMAPPGNVVPGVQQGPTGGAGSADELRRFLQPSR